MTRQRCRDTHLFLFPVEKNYTHLVLTTQKNNMKKIRILEGNKHLERKHLFNSLMLRAYDICNWDHSFLNEHYINWNRHYVDQPLVDLEASSTCHFLDLRPWKTKMNTWKNQPSIKMHFLWKIVIFQFVIFLGVGKIYLKTWRVVKFIGDKKKRPKGHPKCQVPCSQWKTWWCSKKPTTIINSHRTHVNGMFTYIDPIKINPSCSWSYNRPMDPMGLTGCHLDHWNRHSTHVFWVGQLSYAPSCWKDQTLKFRDASLSNVFFANHLFGGKKKQQTHKNV